MRFGWMLVRIAPDLRHGVRYLNSKVPMRPVPIPASSSESTVVKVDREIVEHLEQVSLVDFSTSEAIKRLEEAIRFAEPIREVATHNVEPMFSVLEQQSLRLRPDRVTEYLSKADLLSNASLTEEDYFVAPPGNIALNVDPDKYNY